MQPRSKRSHRHLRPLFALAALGGFAAFALSCSSQGQGTDPSPGAARQAIAGGKADYSHNYVFLLASHVGDRGGLCTSTLIAPNLLLTARHCVSPSSGDESVLCGDAELGEPYPPSAFAATNDPKPSGGSPLFHASEVRVAPGGSDTCGYDIALVILDQNVPSQLATPAVPRIDREVMPGEPYTAVGYGENDAGLPIATRLEREGLSIACQPGSCGDGVESTEFLGETGICSGDSGGPALDADNKVVGVVSRGGVGCDTPVYGTVTAWYDFLVGTATDAAALGGYEAPFWVTTGSSDPPVLEGSGGSAGTGAGGTPAEPPATCTTSSDCSDGLTCQRVQDESLCMRPEPTFGDESGGCSASGHAPAGFGAVLLGTCLSFLVGRRRRR
jgi:hypothetical protein